VDATRVSYIAVRMHYILKYITVFYSAFVDSNTTRIFLFLILNKSLNVIVMCTFIIRVVHVGASDGCGMQNVRER
jgi:hypothetical protein